MEEALLRMEHITFAYDEQEILSDISLSVRRGEKIAVMGCNGAGKSTFFLNLCGVLEPDGGAIFLEGRSMRKKALQELRRRVGFVFQDADSQIIAANVRAEISFGPMNLGLGRDAVKKRVDEAVSYMSLQNLEDRAPHYLSGGEKKRVSIADILAMEPDILIFDEPMAALDPINAQNVEQILERIHADGKTLMISTHDVDFAYRFADRILVFAEGRIIADGTPADIFRRKEIMELAHLKEPSMMTIWQALVEAGAVEDREDYPVTPKQVAQSLLHVEEREGEN